MKMNPSESLKDWCIRNNAWLLLHYYALGGNTKGAEEIGFSSGKKVNWRCHVCNLSWQRAPNHVTRAPVSTDCRKKHR